MLYEAKTKEEIKLQKQVESANLKDEDFRTLYWRLWGGCSTSQIAWKIFENQTKHYLKEVKLNAH